MPLSSAGTDHGNQSPQPSTAAIWARVSVKKAQPSAGKYPRPALANRATNGMSIQVRTAMMRSDQKEANSNSSDQPGISTAVPTPSPIAKTKRPSPKAQSPVNMNFAPTITVRGVGRASNSLAVRSENSRPKTQAVIIANRNPPPMAVPW